MAGHEVFFIQKYFFALDLSLIYLLIIEWNLNNGLYQISNTL